MKSFFALLLLFVLPINIFAQKITTQKTASDTVSKNYIAKANTSAEVKSLTLEKTAVPPKNVKSVQQTTPDIVEVDFFDEVKDEIEDDEYIDAVSDIYKNFSWTSERLNPYRVKIDSLPDTTINCAGFVFPVKGAYITSPFGPRRSRFHYGTDIGLSVGDTVVAIFDGKVRIVDYERRGYGNYVVIQHPNGLESIYAHLSRKFVSINQEVKAGEPIGLGGSTGRSSGPHLHLELRFLGNAFNTAKLIDYENQNCLYEEFPLTKKETFNHKTELEKLKEARYHRVRNGETLSYIAHRYGTTITQLCKLNRLNRNSILRVGRSIRYR
jgi:murein DD-endopeptidase MepM/ murein hydrolase activator NlpD